MSSIFSIVCTVILLLHHSIYVAQSATAKKIQNSTGEFYFNYPTAIQCLKDHCFVICDEENGCKGATINATSSRSLTIECTAAHSCDSMSLAYGSFQNTTIKCTGDMACVDAHFETYPTKFAYVQCLNKGNEADSHIPCYRTSVSTEGAYIAEVSCQGSPGCKFVNFHLLSFKSTVFMEGHWPMYESRVNASGSAVTSLICTSSDDVTSTDYSASEFLVPSASTRLPAVSLIRLSLSFYGAGCNPFGTVVTSTNFSAASVQITGCGDSKCSSATECLPSFDLECNGGKKDSYDGACGSSLCGCDTLVEMAQSNYVKNSDMCPELIPPSKKEKSKPKSSMSGESIAAIVIGVVVMIAVIFGVVWYLVLPTYKDNKKYGAPLINATDELELDLDADAAGDYSAPNDSI